MANGKPIVVSDDPVAAQTLDIGGIHAEPFAEYLGGVLAQQRRRLDRGRGTVEAYREGWHPQFAIGVPHRLDDGALFKARFTEQIASVEHSARWHSSGTDQVHCFVLVVLPRPVGEDLIDFGFVLAACFACRKARILDQRLVADCFQEGAANVPHFRGW